MTNARRDLLVTGAALAALVLSVEAAAAQTRPPPDEPRSEAEGQRDPRQDPRSTGAVGQADEPLSTKLDRTDGVIRPPANIAPDMAVRAPDPNPGTTRIIPPPGSPGGDQSIEPK